MANRAFREEMIGNVETNNEIELSVSKNRVSANYDQISVKYEKIKKAQLPSCCNCSCIKAECHDILTSKKWWPNWFAAILAVEAAIISVIYIDNPSDDPVDELTDNPIDDFFQFYPWKNNPTLTLTKTNTLGIAIFFITVIVCIILYEIVTNYHEINRNDRILPCAKLWSKIGQHIIGYFIFFLFTFLSFFLDAQEDLNSSGIGYSIVSILFGMFMTNIFLFGTGNEVNIWSKATKASTKSCEFYIKVGLVLLATDLQIIYARGAPGLLISWLIPPMIIVFMWFFGVRVLKISNLAFVMTIASGAAICGTSAIAAVAPCVGLGEEDTAIAMAILTFFTMFYMVLVPYICIFANIDHQVCGAWIGGSVDETGKVVASVSILDNQQATDTAVLIKVSQNVLIAFVCLGLAVMYDDMVKYEKTRRKRLLRPRNVSISYQSMSSKDKNMDDDEEKDDNQELNKCAFLWKKFPKFIIGYLGLSVIISVVIIPLTSEAYADRFINNIGQLSRWMFTLGFVGIGAKTKFTTLWESIKDGKYLKLYLCGQTLDTLITFVVAFVVFTYIT